MLQPASPCQRWMSSRATIMASRNLQHSARRARSSSMIGTTRSSTLCVVSYVCSMKASCSSVRSGMGSLLEQRRHRQLLGAAIAVLKLEHDHAGAHAPILSVELPRHLPHNQRIVHPEDAGAGV